MAFLKFCSNEDIVSPECMSYIVISVKNCDGTEGYDIEFLSKEAVEGVTAEKREDNSKKIKRNNEDKAEDTSKDDPETKYAHCDDNLNVRLTLHALKFINPDSVISATDNDEVWVRPSEDKPYIAFAMSMGQTERKDDLFLAEKDVSSYTPSYYLLGSREFTPYCLCLERSHKYVWLPRQ